MDTITRMRAFVAVFDAGGFSAAARATGRSKALMSKYVSELESELGARLLNRTTRQLSLTEAGEAAYEEAREVLGRIDRLKENIEATHAAPRGRLRVSIPAAIGEWGLGQAIMGFTAAHPDIRMELTLEERFVDLVEEGYDVAIRVDALQDSSMIACKLAKFRAIVFASPECIANHGLPHHPADLTALPCIVDTNLKSRSNWPFVEDGARFTVPVSGRVEVNSPATAAAAARLGLGFCRGPWLTVREDLEAGRLVTVLDSFEISGVGIYAVYPHRDRLPAKVRAFIDYLVDWHESERKAGRGI